MKIIIRIIQVIFCTLVTASFAFGSGITSANFMISATVASSATLAMPNSATISSGASSIAASGGDFTANTTIQPTVTFTPANGNSPSRYAFAF